MLQCSNYIANNVQKIKNKSLEVFGQDLSQRFTATTQLWQGNIKKKTER